MNALSDRKRKLITASVAGLLLAGSVGAVATAQAEEAKMEHCYGVNACKGMGACGGKGNSCAGKNACKGQGFVDVAKDSCMKIQNGRLTA